MDSQNRGHDSAVGGLGMGGKGLGGGGGGVEGGGKKKN